MRSTLSLRGDKSNGWQAALLFLALAATGFRIFVWGSLEKLILYQAGTLSFNYIQFGAVRRGLGGSIAYLLSRDALTATVAFHILFTAVVAATTAWLWHRLVAPPATRAATALVMFAIMYRWSEDVGRTDMAVAAVFAATTIAALKDRLVTSAAFVGAGLFVHESSFIFGIPLLVAFFTRRGSTPRSDRRVVQAVAVLVGALLLYVGLDALPHAGRREIVLAVRSRLPIHEHVEWALYFALSGARGVLASMCQNRIDPTYWLHVASGVVIVGLTGFAVVGWRWTRVQSLAWLAAFPGFVFLSIVANDMARWAMFACFNVWLVGITVGAPDETASNGRQATWLRTALAALLLPLICYRPSVVHYRIYAPSPVLEAVARRLGGPPTPSVEEALERCDPHWSDVLNAP